MEKEIYLGPSLGLYNWSMFDTAMSRLKARNLTGDPKLAVYHLLDRNVCVIYARQGIPEDNVRVVLSGTKEGIGEVERIIWRAENERERNLRLKVTTH